MPRNNNRRTPSATGGAAGSFVYAINEVFDESTQQERDLEYDGRTVYAKVTMSDDLEGNLIADVKYYDDAACTILHNVVTALNSDGTPDHSHDVPSHAGIFTNAALNDVTVEKEWEGEATGPANIRVMRTTTADLVAANVNGITQSTVLDQTEWFTYIKGGTLGDNTTLPDGWKVVPGSVWTFPRDPNTVDDGDASTVNDGWRHTFEDLPTRDENGNAIAIKMASLS